MKKIIPIIIGILLLFACPVFADWYYRDFDLYDKTGLDYYEPDVGAGVTTWQKAGTDVWYGTGNSGSGVSIIVGSGVTIFAGGASIFVSEAGVVTISGADVGIGTVPDEKLHVYAGGDVRIHVETITASSSGRARVLLDGPSGGGQLTWVEGATDWFGFWTNDGYAYPFWIDGSHIALQNASGGNVGIGGIPNTNTELDVQGLGSFTTGVSIANTQGVSWPSGASVFESGGSIYVSDSDGTDTKISSHDDKGLFVLESSNKYVGKGITLGIEQFLRDNAPSYVTDYPVPIVDFYKEEAERELSEHGIWVTEYMEANATFEDVDLSSAVTYYIEQIDNPDSGVSTITYAFDPETGSLSEIITWEYEQTGITKYRLKDGYSLDSATGQAKQKVYDEATAELAADKDFVFEPKVLAQWVMDAIQ